MKSDSTFRRHPIGMVVACTNEDRHPAEIIPYGSLGAGAWTGHPIGLVIVIGLLFVEAIAIPWFFATQVALGGLVAFFLWLYHKARRVN